MINGTGLSSIEPEIATEILLAQRRKHRRISTAILNPRAIEEHSGVLDYEANILIRDLYQLSKGGVLPINPQPHAGRNSLNNMLTMVYGTRTESIDDPLVGKALALAREFM